MKGFRSPSRNRHISGVNAPIPPLRRSLKFGRRLLPKRPKAFRLHAVVVREPWVCLIMVIEVSIWFQIAPGPILTGIVPPCSPGAPPVRRHSACTNIRGPAIPCRRTLSLGVHQLNVQNGATPFLRCPEINSFRKKNLSLQKPPVIPHVHSVSTCPSG
ncbi:MAG: hypothetical protein CM1200mP30_25590 [Pseudomonadota bacterium]|nr:MAG: hypothetical protein CM1200mP30_25590 [Pseudomonadota bacterium]